MVLRRLTLLFLFFLLVVPAEAARQVAVFDFENRSGSEAREKYSWISFNVPETIAGKLAEVPGVQVIERAQWKKLVQELYLQRSDLFDEKKAAQLGGFLGAKVVIVGSFVVFEERADFNLRFVDVETGMLLGALSHISPLDDRLFEALTALALGAVQVLNHRVTNGEVGALPPTERLEITEETKKKIQRRLAKSLEAYILFAKGNEADDQNRSDEAIGLYRAALSLDPDCPEVWQGFGIVLTKNGRWEEAEEAGRHALSLFMEEGDERGKGGVLSDMGLVAVSGGRYDEAESLYQESLEISKTLGNDVFVGRALHNLGNVAWTRGRFEEAERLYQDALAVRRKIRDARGIGETLNNLGIIARRQGRYDEAQRFYQESLEISRGLNNELGVAETLFNIAIIEESQGSRDQAIRYATEALEILRRIGAPQARPVQDFLRELEGR